MEGSSYNGYLRAKFIGCQIADQVFFQPQKIDIESDIGKICRIRKNLSRQINAGNIDEDARGCISYLHMTYLREVWVAESPDKFSEGETVEITTALVEGSNKPENVSERVWIKLQNLHIALQFVLALSVNTTSQSFSPPSMSFDMIMELHRRIGNGIIASAGTLRSVYVGASGTPVCYAAPTTISTRLKSLIKFVNTESSSMSSQYRDAPSRLRLFLRLSAFFFAEFLKIHPFANGNGRTARLLVSFLLYPVCIVPISVFGAHTRDTFLKVLVEAQWNDNPAPLTSMFLVSAKRTAFMAEYLMLDADEDYADEISPSVCCIF
jgi:fido (protein-threonine AMPylation protein)